MKRRRNIQAFNTSIGVGFAHIEPIPTFHPPSLRSNPEEHATKLMQRLFKQSEEMKHRFEFEYLRHQTPILPPHVITTAPVPPAYFYSPLIVGSARKRSR